MYVPTIVEVSSVRYRCAWYHPLPALIVRSQDPSTEVPFIVLIFVPLTSVSCFDVASQLYCVFVALSHVFVPLVFPITVSCESVTYLLSVLSEISAVVASVPLVTKPFEP